jgi:hypothetical protein
MSVNKGFHGMSLDAPNEKQTFETTRVCEQAVARREAPGGSPDARYLRTEADERNTKTTSAFKFLVFFFNGARAQLKIVPLQINSLRKLSRLYNGFITRT